MLAIYEVKAAAAGLAVCLIGISAAVYRASTKLVENARWVAHTHDVLTQLEATAAGVTKAEAELRGFLMTDQESYLVPYSAGLTKTRHRLEAVRKLTADNPRQQARVDKLERLILHRLDLLEALLKIGHDQGFGAARRILTFDQGPQYMEEIRQGIQDMEHEEQEILASRFAQQEYPRVREVFTRESVLASRLVQGTFARETGARHGLVDAAHRGIGGLCLRLRVATVRRAKPACRSPRADDARQLGGVPGGTGGHYRGRSIHGRPLTLSVIRGNLVGCLGSSIRRTSFSSQPSFRANCTLVLVIPASRIAR